MLDTRLCLVLLAALAGCSDEPKDDSQNLEITQDAGNAGVDAFNVTPDPDDGVAPPLDAALPPDEGPQPVDQGVEPDPDAAVVVPDMGVEPRLEGAVATVTVVQQPDDAQLNVAVTRFVEPMPGQGDCEQVRVDPDDAPEVAPQLAAGPIVVDGLRGGPYTFALAGGTYQPDRPIPAELFDDAATIRATAGGALPFDLSLDAPRSIVLQSPSGFATLPADADLTVRWNAAGGDAVLITVFPLENFAPARGEWLFCGAADTGSFTIRGADLAESAGGGLIPGPNALVAVTRIRTLSEGVGTSRAILTATTSQGAPVVLE